MQSNPKESTRTLASMSTDHSILCQNFHSTELLNATEPTMYGSEDGERMLWANNGSLIQFPKLSSPNNGNITHLTSKETVAPLTLDVLLPIQDGGNSSELKVDTSSTREEKF
jgi:hypothetical protein